MVLMSIFSQLILVAAKPPKIFIDKGACPFECCTYREWVVVRDTPLYDNIKSKKIIGKAKKGEKVQGLTREVHTVPLKVKTKDGKNIFLLTYQGEGFWKIWVLLNLILNKTGKMNAPIVHGGLRSSFQMALRGGLNQLKVSIILMLVDSQIYLNRKVAS